MTWCRAACTLALLGVALVYATLRAIAWLDDLLDRRQQARAVTAEAEQYTRAAAQDGDQQP